ncbi:DUF1192 domain-containing protein [Camelimonas fluminis]|uniref:DUF1192 domain-containing protein n=1 Tax=Camelimonas fluminis TaxID=1576911 RepID=A0ABV7UJ83_9HYPH|nr:DUF1192 domain-containing protein [Camelimonas fluminis]
MSDPFGDEPRSRPGQQLEHQIGQDLSTLSLHELDERIVLLRAEIARLEQARAGKAASRDAAASAFRF